MVSLDVEVPDSVCRAAGYPFQSYLHRSLGEIVGEVCHRRRDDCPDEIVRRITPSEAARLQTIPEWYKWECSATQQHTMLGNGWTVEVIKHIFSFLQL